MRKFFGFFLVVGAMLFLGMAYVELASAEEPGCDSVLANKIVELVKSDKSKILDMQLELTALKLARETLSANRTTVEGYIKKQEALIANLDDQDVRGKLKILYQRFGESEDVEAIEAALQSSVEKAKNGTYFKKSARFKNKDVSAYVLAKTLTESASGFDRNDVAILWFQSEISEGVEAEKGRGSAEANLQEVSTRIAQLTGVAGTTGKSPEEITDLIQIHEQLIGEAFDRIALEFGDDLKKSCSEMSTCKDCPVTAAENRLSEDNKKKALNKALMSIVESLQKEAPAREAKIKKVIADLKAADCTLEREPAQAAPAPSPMPSPSPKPSVAPFVSPKTIILESDQTSVKMPVPVLMPSAKPSIKTPSALLKRPKVFPKMVDQCSAQYSVTQDGATRKVSFKIIKKDSSIACEGSYKLSTVMIRDEAAWDDSRINEVCGNFQSLCGGANGQ